MSLLPYILRRVTLSIVLLLLLTYTGCATTEEAIFSETGARPTMTELPTSQVWWAEEGSPASISDQVTLILWHRWPEDRAATLRGIIDWYEAGRPDLRVRMIYYDDLYAALARVSGTPDAPHLVIISGDRVAPCVARGQLSSLDVYIDRTWLETHFLDSTLNTLRYQGKLWGLPLHQQTVTFIINRRLISEHSLVAGTSDLVAKAHAFREEHDGFWYLAYASHNDAYFAAPWFYGAGAWYGKEDGSVGLDSSAGADTVSLLAALCEVMPPGMDYGKSDALFKQGKAAITINGPWYLSELDAAGVPYTLQIMPIVSSSGRPARPFVTVEGIALGSNPQFIEEAVRLAAHLAGPDSQVRLARDHSLVPANRLAVERIEDEGMSILVHFARQAALGEPLPTTPWLDLVWEPVSELIIAACGDVDPDTALQRAQATAEAHIRKAKGQ